MRGLLLEGLLLSAGGNMSCSVAAGHIRILHVNTCFRKVLLDVVGKVYKPDLIRNM